MNIIIVGASPYLFSRDGRIHSSLITSLKREGHNIFSASWNHDDSYFLPQESGHFFFEQGDENICQIFPINPERDGSVPLYELMKKTAPDVLLTVGDYKDTSFVWEIKSMLPNLFKWVAVLTNDAAPFNDRIISHFEYADQVVVVNDFSEAEIEKFNIEFSKVYFGPKKYFSGSNLNAKNMYLCMGKNSRSCNPASFIKANRNMPEGVISYLHTNLYDVGDYDLHLLQDRFGSKVDLPERFVSIKESISDEDLCDIYANHQFIVDCSVKSSTALSMLESMRFGCVPIGINHGRTGEILREIGDERLIIPSVEYTDTEEESVFIINEEGLSRSLVELYNWSQNCQKEFQNLSDKCQEISNRYSQENFENQLSQILQNTVNKNGVIAIDSF